MNFTWIKKKLGKYIIKEWEEDIGPMKTYKQGKYTIIINDSGTKIWRYKGKDHRENGPSIITKEGTKQWWIHGKLHREDGPAIEWDDGSKEWYLNNERYSEKEWQVKMRKRKLEVLGL